MDLPFSLALGRRQPLSAPAMTAPDEKAPTKAVIRPKARAPRGFLDRRAAAAGRRAAHPGGGVARL